MNEGELIDLVASVLTENTGERAVHWYRVLGGVMMHEPSRPNGCNWSMAPSGNAVDVRAAQSAISVIQKEHPIIIPE